MTSAVAATLHDRADALFDLAGTLPHLFELDASRIEANSDQPRKSMDESGLDQLVRSIERHGLLQPLVVQAVGSSGRYALVAGHRRLAALRRLGRERVPALLATGASDELALIENLQREDLHPLDEAEALAALRRRHGYTQEQLAQVMAKAKEPNANRQLDLWQALADGGSTTVRAARARRRRHISSRQRATRSFGDSNKPRAPSSMPRREPSSRRSMVAFRLCSTWPRIDDCGRHGDTLRERFRRTHRSFVC